MWKLIANARALVRVALVSAIGAVCVGRALGRDTVVAEALDGIASVALAAGVVID